MNFSNFFKYFGIFAFIGVFFWITFKVMVVTFRVAMQIFAVIGALMVFFSPMLLDS